MEAWKNPNPSCSNGMVVFDASRKEEPTGYYADAVNNNDDDYLDSFPPGFRFCPHDEELVLYYLKKKVMNLPLPQNRIMEVNLYSYNPEKLAEQHKQYGEKEWYFFTPRDKKYRNGSRPNRAAGDGFWKATGADREIRFNDCVIGYRKALVFYNGKPPRGDKSNWIMHEYRVNDPPSPRKERAGYTDMRLDDWVLCRIYKKLKKSGRTQAKSDAEEPVIEKPEEPNGLIMGLDDNEIIDYNEYFNPVMDQSLVDETLSNIQHVYNEQLLPYFSTTCPNEMLEQRDKLLISVENVDIPMPVGLYVEPWVSLDFSTDDKKKI